MVLVHNPNELPDDLPVPFDDGACDHLVGLRVPQLLLPSTLGGSVSIAANASRSVVFFYPRTGRPGEPPLVENWDQIAGARGCTPQTCGIRDYVGEFLSLGYRVFGVSTQTPEYQLEMSQRLGVPFPVLSDAGMELARALRLPTFVAAGQELIKRLALIVEDGIIVKAFYPVFPPDRNAANVLAWISERAR